MTHQELFKLYQLKGRVLGMMEVTKAELRANHNVRSIHPAYADRRWLDGRNAVAIKMSQNLNSLRRDICQIIKEAENAEEDKNLPF